MNRESLDRWCERGILASVLTILVFTPLAFGGKAQPPGGFFLDFLVVNPFVVAQVLTIVVLGLWGLRFWLSPRPQLLWPPICWVVTAFTLYAIMRYLNADIEYVARQELMRVLVYASLFFAILNNVHRQESTQTIVFTMIGLAMVISAYAIYQFINDSDRVWHVLKPYTHRGSGTYISPNHLGGLLEMLLPMGLAYTLLSRLKPVGKVLLGYAVLIILGGIAVTVSRGAWLSTTIAAMLFFGVLFFYDKFRLPSLIFLVVMLFFSGYFFPKTHTFQVRIRQLFANGKIDPDLRFDLWRPAMKIWRENPWWGAGPAHFDYRFRMYRPEIVQLQPERAHNDLLNVMTDWGMVGTVLVMSGWVLLYVGVFRTWRFVRGIPSDLEQKSSNKFALVLGAATGLTAIMVHSGVDFNMHIPANALLAVTLMAFLSSHLRFATERYWRTMAVWMKVAGTALVVAGIIYLGGQAWRQASEKVWLARATLAPNFSPTQIQFLKKAFAIEPKNFETAYGIGEAYWRQTKDGGEDYRELAAQAMEWFGRSMKLNPWDGYGFLRYGMCLDWVDRSDESRPYFTRAEQLDPNGYFTVANIGLHYVQMRNFAAAKPWFERSLRLQSENNDIAYSYLKVVTRRLMEAATNEITGKLDFSGR